MVSVMRASAWELAAEVRTMRSRGDIMHHSAKARASGEHAKGVTIAHDNNTPSHAQTNASAHGQHLTQSHDKKSKFRLVTGGGSASAGLRQKMAGNTV